MKFSIFLNQLNIPAQCKKYNIPLWQCPSFLFLLMGLVIVVSSLIAYLLGMRYIEDPAIVALVILGLAAVLFIMTFVITQGFERLAEANRMKSEFINIVSHQLRTPLSNLKWSIELLMSGRLDHIGEKQTEYFRILKENTARMEELVGDLLVVSRLETGKLPLKKKEFSLEELARELILIFEPFASASNVQVKLENSPDLPKILADASQIKLVIENLLDNAIRYIKKQGQIKIKFNRKNNNIYFTISDNGVGIPLDDQKYIFQKFFRSKNALRYQTQGSGLGLYIAKSIIERSGGKIGFHSKENKGSTFWFTLPIK